MIEPLFRPATEADLCEWYGRLPGYSIKAWVLEVDGEVMGIGGLAYHRGRPNHLFTEWKPGLKRFPVSMIKAMRRGLEQLRGAPALARIQKDEPQAERISRMMGLTPAGADQEGKLYRWDS